MADTLLYLMAKPPLELWSTLASYRASLGIGLGYAPERHHCTLLRLGQSTPASIAAASHALSRFQEEPFEVVFDYIDGNFLKGRKAQPAALAFQRALSRHMIFCGAPVVRRRFWLHLSLDYGSPPLTRLKIEPLAWTVDRILLIESGDGRHVTHGCRHLVQKQALLQF